MSFRALRRSCLLALLFGTIGCDALTGLNELNEIFGTPLLAISVSQEQGNVVEVGDTIRLTATGDVGGIIGMFVYDRLLDARWSVADPTIAQLQALPLPPPEDTVSPTRTLVRGLRPGSTQVRAAARGITGQAPVRVIPVLGGIQMRTSRDTVFIGDTITASATVLDIGGTVVSGVPVTFAVTGGGRLNGYDDTSARVVATDQGTATVSARLRRVSAESVIFVVPRAP